ncbi:MAG: hypothetical protein ABI999_09285 [Acidobacteriota bacterium]
MPLNSTNTSNAFERSNGLNAVEHLNIRTCEYLNTSGNLEFVPSN